VICAEFGRRGAIRLMDVTVTGPDDTCTLWPHILVSLLAISPVPLRGNNNNNNSRCGRGAGERRTAGHRRRPKPWLRTGADGGTADYVRRCDDSVQNRWDSAFRALARWTWASRAYAIACLVVGRVCSGRAAACPFVPSLHTLHKKRNMYLHTDGGRGAG